MRKILPLILLFAGVCRADIAVTAEARKGVFLTVYRDFGVVKDIRTVDIPKGVNKIRFEEVAAGIRSSSVFLEWPEKSSLELLGQNYEFDLISPAKLLEKYVGKTLEVVPRKGSWPDTSVQTAELISIHGEEPVFRIGTKITFGNIGQIMFPYMPDNMYTKPTLIWDINSPLRQNVELTATYITEGISWKAGYVVYIDKKDGGGSFAGWLEFDNRAGFNFKDANITFVSGNIRRISDVKAKQLTTSGTNEGGGDFNLYSVNQPVTIGDNQVKQIEWIPKIRVKLRQIQFVDFTQDSMVNDKNSQIGWTAIEIDNSESNGLGMPLPPGIVRVFRKDAQSNNWFLGEDFIGETPAKKSFVFRTGTNHDITAVKTIDIKRQQGEEVRDVLVSNNRDKDMSIKVRDIVSCGKGISCNENYTRLDASTVEWDLVVKARQTYSLTYTVKKK